MSRLPCQARKAEEQGSEARSLVPRKCKRRSNWRLDDCVPVAMAAAGDPPPPAQAIERGRGGETPRFSCGAPSASPETLAALVLACFDHECSKKRLNYALRRPNQ